ncbi:MAG TPA: MoxR family ATPase [Thermoanaerobaculia bacterium]|nr:MoxR family ATPase [Thermoanaerobaculia bacterium]
MTEAHEKIARLRAEVARAVIGQEVVVDRLVIALLIRGHVLIEGLPGLAKTLLVKTLASATDATFKRIQFTPDLLPADITGTQIFDPAGRTFNVRRGPIFANFVLADEINRAPAKVQSALLEAMQERQVTIDGESHELSDRFMVVATQNPIEQQGVYPLPEAQLDRFLFKLSMGYMSRDTEYEVMFDNSVQLSIEDLGPVIDTKVVRAMIDYAANIEVSPEVGYYMVDLVQASRKDPSVAMGGSPRATIALLRAARCLAASDGREHVYPDDVRAVLRPVMAHRIVLNPDAMLRGDTIDAVLERMTSAVKPPLSARRSKTGA